MNLSINCFKIINQISPWRIFKNQNQEIKEAPFLTEETKSFLIERGVVIIMLNHKQYRFEKLETKPIEKLETKSNLLYRILKELHEVETNIHKLEMILKPSQPDDETKSQLLVPTRKNK